MEDEGLFFELPIEVLSVIFQWVGPKGLGCSASVRTILIFLLADQPL